MKPYKLGIHCMAALSDAIGNIARAMPIESHIMVIAVSTDGEHSMCWETGHMTHAQLDDAVNAYKAHQGVYSSIPHDMVMNAEYGVPENQIPQGNVFDLFKRPK